MWLGLAVVVLWSLAALSLVAARWIDPPTTALHIERRMQAWMHGTPYRERYTFIPLNQISPNFQHAVISAEDARFYQHHGFDWHAIQVDAEEDLEGDRVRGGSTLTQQLVKNLFFGTGGSIFRKGAEFTLVPVAELVLGKQRILELYLNVVEWGPGIYGADAACRTWDRTAARNIGRNSRRGWPRFARSAEATAGAHESLQRGHPEADEPGGLVAGRRHEFRMGVGGTSILRPCV